MANKIYKNGGQSFPLYFDNDLKKIYDDKAKRSGRSVSFHINDDLRKVNK